MDEFEEPVYETPAAWLARHESSPPIWWEHGEDEWDETYEKLARTPPAAWSYSCGDPEGRAEATFVVLEEVRFPLRGIGGWFFIGSLGLGFGLGFVVVGAWV